MIKISYDITDPFAWTRNLIIVVDDKSFISSLWDSFILDARFTVKSKQERIDILEELISQDVIENNIDVDRIPEILKCLKESKLVKCYEIT
jgi:hypothetical protein